MKNNPAAIFVTFAASLFVGSVGACPSNLPFDEYVSCLSIEESGQPYEEYLAELQSHMAQKYIPQSLPRKKQTRLGFYITAPQAHRLMMDEGDTALFLDVRTRAEVAFLGMPASADANVPYMTVDWTEWDERKRNFRLSPNSSFVADVAALLEHKGLTPHSRVMLICRSGSRSARAADLLTKAGFTNVYSVTDGYEGDKRKNGNQHGQRVVNGWKNNNLPWSYALDQEKMYLSM
ncbi:MAG: rhodanese-like domain-containing protein [Pseudomonadota bacterium]